MGQAIHCAFARVGVTTLIVKHSQSHRGLPVGAMKEIFPVCASW